MKPDEVRAILMKTARDLGAPGRDNLFGAGEADAYAAVLAVAPARRRPWSHEFQGPPPEEKLYPDRQDAPATRALNQPPARHGVRKSRPLARGQFEPAARVVFRP